MSVHVHPICHIHVHYFPPLHVRQSICDTLPCTVFLCFFCICMPVHPPIGHIHTHNVFHICLCVCVFLRPYAVYHVHSYVSVCLSATFMYTICPFRTFLRLSVDLRVFVYVYFHVNILHVQLFVRLLISYIRAPSSQYVSVCLAVHSSKFRLCL